MVLELIEEEKQFIKDEYAKEQKQIQIKALEKKKWEDVDLLKKSNDPLKHKKIQEIKAKCREDIANL
jgi:hypothetical protein